MNGTIIWGLLCSFSSLPGICSPPASKKDLYEASMVLKALKIRPRTRFIAFPQAFYDGGSGGAVRRNSVKLNENRISTEEAQIVVWTELLEN